MKRRIFTLLTLSLLAFNGMSQQEIPCGTDQALESLHTQFPQLKAEYDMNVLLQNSRQTKTVIENGVEKKATNYIIPVVFHVLHEYGTENVSDASIYALMEDLNEDYSASNPDITNVIPQFDTIIGDVGVEFRLASKDPFGNCTNGIEHIYTHETNMGESVSKINQWDRSHYMNIWVVHEPNSGGNTPGVLLGYATFPTSTDGSGFWTDGIVMRDWTVTSNDRTLTHEAGHYLGLLHPFNGSNAEDGTCGDDGIEDTPPADGSFSTCNLAKATCLDTAGVAQVENVQNIMDYSSCAVMFTEDQATAMNNTLAGIAGQRNILTTDTTLIETGVLNSTMPQTALNVPLCTAVADFNADKKTVCIGSFVSFQDASWNAVVDSRSWTFEDGSPATSTSANPSVSFTSSGWKQVTLSVTNAAGTDTRQENHYIYVSPDYAQNVGPTSFNMESTNAWATGTNFFIVENIEDNHGSFSVVNNYGYDGSKAFKLNTFKDVSAADPYTEDWFYNFRLGGSVDNLITPSVELKYTTNVTVTFMYSYATNATQSADITEELRVYSSKNCGETWTPKIISVDGTIAGSTVTGDDLVTAGYASNSDFAPTSNSMWRQGSFTYAANSTDDATRFKFEFTASDNSSNLYIDNININGTLGVQDQVIIDLELSVFPNPTNGEGVTVNYQAQNEATEFILRDVQGKIIAQQVINTTNSQVTQKLDNTQNLPSACYFLEVKTGDYSTTKKVVVL